MSSCLVTVICLFLNFDKQPSYQLDEIGLLRKHGAKIEYSPEGNIIKVIFPLKIDSNGHYRTVPSVVFRAIRSLPSLRQLDLSYTNFSDEDAQYIVGLSLLESLTLCGTDISDNGVNCIASAKLKKLRHLDLSSTKKIHGDCYKELVRFEGLQSLYLIGKIIATDTETQALASLKQLLTIRLCWTRLRPGQLRLILESLQNLEHLDITGCDFSDVDVHVIGKLNNLRSLDLSFTKITGIALKELRSIPHLNSLSLCRTDISGENMTYIGSLQSLTELKLDGTNITNSDLTYVSKIKTLRVLTISRTSISDGGAKILRYMIWLEKLKISRTEITPAGYVRLNEDLFKTDIEYEIYN